jgi:hypothetical protein
MCIDIFGEKQNTGKGEDRGTTDPGNTKRGISRPGGVSTVGQSYSLWVLFLDEATTETCSENQLK